MAKPWFRLYSEFLADPKVQLLAFEDQRHFVGILCLKCNGILDTTSMGPDHYERMISKALGLDPASGAEAKRRLVEANLITESWQPIAWDRRQFESDSSTSRVHQWRTAKQSETLQKRSSNVLDSDSDSDTDTYKTKSKRGANAPLPRPPSTVDSIRREVRGLASTMKMPGS